MKNRKLSTNTVRAGAVAAALLLAAPIAGAQDIHFTQFQAAPLIVNPAFTGAFDGTLRAAAIYRDQWRSVTAPFKTFAASVDAPLIPDLSIDDYLAGGLQVYNDRAGDGNLQNTTVLASVAYHKFLGSTGGTSATELNKVLTIGLQGGYTSKSIDLSRLYFGDEFNNGIYGQGTSREYPGLNNKVDYWTVNAGLAWAHAPSAKFNYTVGLGANNLNQPTDKFRKERNSEVGLAMRYTGQAGAVWYWGDKFSFRPGVLYQNQASSQEVVAGAEFNYAFGYPEFRSIASSIFAGVWTRTGDALMVTAGFEYRAFRFGIGYDYNTSALNTASSGNGAFEISLRYIAPSPADFGRFRTYPCTRF